VLRESLAGLPHFLWDETGENPYFGILGLADYVVVTIDSINMVSEALATGKPVYVADLPGGSEKFRCFHRTMCAEGLTRPFEGSLERYSYASPDDLKIVAERVQELLSKQLA
jgi:mitochondrial fission protein ELM1